MKLCKVVGVKPFGKGRVFDIEVNSPRHAFVAMSENGAMGISHNSAILSLSNPSDDRMRYAKSGNWFELTPWRAMANNSSCYTEKPGMDVFFREWLALYESKSGERGIFNRMAAKKQAEKYGVRDSSHEFICNPCLTRETLVAVADGRGNVPIGRLAEEGCDVPVYCRDHQGKIAVRMMRNPHMTRKNAEVLRVGLDDGSFVRVTPNHKFLLRDGRYVEARYLQTGDSLEIMTKYQSSLDWLLKEKKRSGDYWWVNHNRKNIAEHRLIASFARGDTIRRGEVVHHHDRNGLNNRWDNLCVMSKDEHDKHHSEMMRGKNNPMSKAVREWSNERLVQYKRLQSANNSGKNNHNCLDVCHDEIVEHALSLTSMLGRRYTVKEWQKYAKEHNIPQMFSGWRKKKLGDVLDLAMWAAERCGVENGRIDPRVVRTLENALKHGYAAHIEDGEVYVKRTCEECGGVFHVVWSHRGASFCSHTCVSRKTWRFERDSRIAALRRAWCDKKSIIREKQLDVFTLLKGELSRLPLKAEWVRKCKQMSVSVEISRKSSPFQTWNDLQEAAACFNHRVVSVEPCGKEDVYCGSVDEFHNFFVGGFKSDTKDGKEKFVYINNMNCSEIILRSRQCCNLSEVVVKPSDTEKTLLRKVRLAAIFGTMQATLTNFRYLSSTWKLNTEEEALLGVSLTGVMDNELTSGRNGKTELKDLLGKLREHVVQVNKEWAKKLGINQSVSTTCCKPSGTISQLTDCASGIHARFSEYYIRTVRADLKDPLAKMMIDAGFPWERDVSKPGSVAVFSFPIKSPDGATTADKMSAMEQLELWKIYQNHWCTHKPSCTVYVKEHEWMEVGAWVYRHFDEVSGVSFLPAVGHTYKQAPYQPITKEEYEKALEAMPKNVDWNKLKEYETDDDSVIHGEIACSGGACEIVDLVKK